MSNDTPKVIGAPAVMWLYDREDDHAPEVKYVRSDIVYSMRDMLKLCRYHIEYNTPMMDRLMRNSLLMDIDRAIAKAEGVLND